MLEGEPQWFKLARALGPGYTFTSVLGGLKTALKAEKINTDSIDWDPKKLK
jgi:hypothetical protein